MTNQELLSRMNKELNPTYQIGLHSVCIGTYHDRLIFCPDNIKKGYHINKEQITEQDIINNILKKGLNVYESYFGLCSTVKFEGTINELDKKTFDYGYWFDYGSIKHNQVYNVIVVIPSYIKIKEKNYFIGNYKNKLNIATYSLFYKLLPKEFIYGYYVKNYNKVNNEYNFNEELQFFKNPNFYDNLPDKEIFWQKYFKENNINISLLEAVNNPTIFNNLFQNSRNRIAIKSTRNQIKILKKELGK